MIKNKTKLLVSAKITAAILASITVAFVGVYLLRPSKASVAQPSDINNDNIVDIFDLSTLLSNWNKTGTSTSDINSDNIVNIFDLSMLLSKWGPVAVVTPTVTPTPGAQACPAFPAFPDANCTGVPVGTALTTVNGDLTVTTAGSVIEGKKITGTLYINANNVTVRNSEIYGAVYNGRDGVDRPFTIEDSTIGNVSGCNSNEAIGYSNYTARRVHIRNHGDGFRVSGDNILIEESFVSLCSIPGDHSDGIQGYFGGQNVVIRHNTIDQRAATDVTSPIFFADNSESAIIQNNLVAGGGYSIRIHDDFNPDRGPWSVTGNRIVDGAWFAGPVSTTNTNCATTTWSDNRIVTIDANYAITGTGATVACQ